MNGDILARVAVARCIWPGVAVPTSLTAEDVAQHKALGIPPELLEQAGVARVTGAEACALLSSRHSGDVAGVVNPYCDPAAGKPLTSRLRRDHPEIENGKPRDKYLSARGRLLAPTRSGGRRGRWRWPVRAREAAKTLFRSRP